MKKILIGIAVLVLLAAAGFQFFGSASWRNRLVAPNIAELIPREIPGWTVEDKPVADSPEMLKTVEKVLSYDSAIFRIYRQGDREISVYAAYWLPGKVPDSHVDAHTPDICWVANGWKMEKESPLESQTTASGVVPVPNVRQFMVSGHALSVVYWHVKGSELRQANSVWERTLSFRQRVSRRMGQFIDVVFTPPGQQLFVRVSSNHNIAADMKSAPMQACLNLIAKTLSGETLYEESPN